MRLASTHALTLATTSLGLWMLVTLSSVSVFYLPGCSSSAPDAASPNTDDAGAGATAPSVTFTKVDTQKRTGYTVESYVFKLPKYRSKPTTATISLNVTVILPDGVALDAPVFYATGDEGPFVESKLAAVRTGFEDPKHPSGLVWVAAEHRGYGSSLSDDADQTVPDYVTLDESVADNHDVLTALKATYTGPWIAGGWSYGGTHSIVYGAKYPADVAVVYASSAPVDWPFVNATYEPFTKQRLGDKAYGHLVQHGQTLKPAALFDDNYVEREFLETVVIGLTQYSAYTAQLPTLQAGLALDTTSLLEALHSADDMLGGLARERAVAFSKKGLTRDEAATGKFNWYTFKYQMCHELGIFDGSPGPNAFFVRTEADWRAECAAQFGEGVVPSPFTPRSMRGDLDKLAAAHVPVVMITGAKDPWSAVSMEVPDGAPTSERTDYKVYGAPYGTMFLAPDGFHGPDRDIKPLAVASLGAAIDFARAAQAAAP